MIKEFFEEHDHLCLKLQHISRFGGGWQIRIYNTTLDFGCREPIYEHIILDSEFNDSNADFETIIMGNCIVMEDTNGNRKLLKKRHEAKIDSVAAMLDAFVAFKNNREAFE